MKLSRQGSMMSISLSNPYEGIARFMSDSEIEPRIIDPNELMDLQAMYDDFLELSTRYDDLKFDRDTIIQTIEDSLLSIPDLAREVQATNLDDDRTRHQTLNRTFEILRTKYSATPKPNQYTPNADSLDGLKFQVEQQQIGNFFSISIIFQLLLAWLKAGIPNFVSCGLPRPKPGIPNFVSCGLPWPKPGSPTLSAAVCRGPNLGPPLCQLQCPEAQTWVP
jgi:hypothetical protein